MTKDEYDNGILSVKIVLTVIFIQLFILTGYFISTSYSNNWSIIPSTISLSGGYLLIKYWCKIK